MTAAGAAAVAPLGAVASRPIMWDMPAGLQALWYFLVAVSIAVFSYGVWRAVRSYRRGNTDSLPPARELPRRTWRALADLYAHASIARRDRYAGWSHRAIFYGWITLAAGTVIVALSHDVAGPLFGAEFYEGTFYLACKAFLNLLGTALIAGLLAMMVRRALLRPAKLTYAAGDWVFVVALLLIAITGYLLEGVRIAMEHPGYDLVQFGGWIAARPFEGASEATLSAWRHGLWWFHGILAITIVASIPYTKAVHMLSSFASMVLRDPRAGRRLAPIPAARAEEPAGYGDFPDFSVNHLLQLDACTKCGRCHEACPALATGRPLSPRDVVLDLRAQAHQGASGEDGGVIGPGGVREETLWSCMQCNACVAACPVGIEQAPIINQLRRRLLEDGELDAGLQSTLKTINKSGNSFGAKRRKRGEWTAELDFEVKDAREEPVELLWFVGDYASFDPRSQRVTLALARTLHEAGVDFGILYDGESNAGNDVRRAGEEGLFELLAERNVEAISACEFDRIVTSDPHSLNTLANEYPDYGGRWQVVHHTELLLELFEEERLTPRAPLGYRVTYHDPCYLGRHNDVYEAPRKLLELLGCELVEMPRNRTNSFCCGAGGGQIWISDQLGDERPSEIRIREATELGELDLFVVACPKDVTMYEDAIKTTGNAENLTLRELTELVDEALVAATPS